MTVKKAELHVHLESTIRPALAKKLAQRNKLRLPANLITADDQSYSYPDFLGFLRAFDEVAAVIKHPRDYYDLTFDYLKANAEENTIYVEMMYSPHGQNFQAVFLLVSIYKRFSKLLMMLKQNLIL